MTFSIAIGGLCQQPGDFARAAQRVAYCFEILRVLNRSNQVINYEDLGIYRVLLERQNKQVLFDFAAAQLQTLREYDDLHHTSLIQTLQTYLALDKNLKETAVACHIHPNALKYRLKRIEEVGTLQLNNAEVCFNIQLSLKILQLEKSVNTRELINPLIL